MPVVHFSTDAMPAAERLSRFQDELGRRLTSADTGVPSAGLRPFRVAWSHVAGSTLALVMTEVSSLNARRRPRCLRDGDDDFSYFTATRRPIRCDHNGRRFVLAPGEGVLVAHALPVETWWGDAGAFVVRLPRAAFPDPGAADAVAGRSIPRGHPVQRLLGPYQRSVWTDATACDGRALPDAAERNLATLVASLAATSGAAGWRAIRAALGPARVAAMLEVMARRAAEPGLGMGEVAAAVGLSERSGHSAFAAAGLGFGECLARLRLDRVHEWLAAGGPGWIGDAALGAGFGDISHFNRLFRRRFGASPGELRVRRSGQGQMAYRAG